uniref:AB hydrolase-1 domain-containing protein n=1 Tax=Salix viminalis TaxID=40686 RepID=A0A6N2MGK4_SALVM
MEGIFYLEHDIKGLWGIDWLLFLGYSQFLNRNIEGELFLVSDHVYQGLISDNAILLDSFIGDMREVVADVGNRYPNANLDAVGWSLGANIIWLRHAILFEDMGGEYNIPSVAIPDSVTEFDANPSNFDFASNDLTAQPDETLVKISTYCSYPASLYLFFFLDRYQVILDGHLPPTPTILRLNLKGQATLAVQHMESVKLTRDRAFPNCLLVVTPKGGRLWWIAGAEPPLGSPWTDTVVMGFMSI